MNDNEWHIKSAWMKTLFVLAAAWGIINTIVFITYFFVGFFSA